MSSLFLNSPLTKTTFPFSSNSVQRSLGSFAALGEIARPRLNIEVPSSRPRAGKSSARSGPPPVLDLLPKSFWRHDHLLDFTLKLRSVVQGFSYDLTFPRFLPSLALGPVSLSEGLIEPDRRKFKLIIEASSTLHRGTSVIRCLEEEKNVRGFDCETRGATCSVLFPGCGLEQKNQQLSVWDLRNLRRADDGTGPCSEVRMAAKMCLGGLPLQNVRTSFIPIITAWDFTPGARTRIAQGLGGLI